MKNSRQLDICSENTIPLFFTQFALLPFLLRQSSYFQTSGLIFAPELCDKQVRLCEIIPHRKRDAFAWRKTFSLFHCLFIVSELSVFSAALQPCLLSVRPTGRRNRSRHDETLSCRAHLFVSVFTCEESSWFQARFDVVHFKNVLGNWFFCRMNCLIILTNQRDSKSAKAH